MLHVHINNNVYIFLPRMFALSILHVRGRMHLHLHNSMTSYINEYYRKITSLSSTHTNLPYDINTKTIEQLMK